MKCWISDVRRTKSLPKQHCWHQTKITAMDYAEGYHPAHPQTVYTCCWCDMKKTRRCRFWIMPGHGPWVKAKDSSWVTEYWDTWAGTDGDSNVCRGYGRLK